MYKLSFRRLKVRGEEVSKSNYHIIPIPNHTLNLPFILAYDTCHSRKISRSSARPSTGVLARNVDNAATPSAEDLTLELPGSFFPLPQDNEPDSYLPMANAPLNGDTLIPISEYDMMQELLEPSSETAPSSDLSIHPPQQSKLPRRPHHPQSFAPKQAQQYEYQMEDQPFAPFATFNNGEGQRIADAEVMFSYYDFVEAESMSHLAFEDFKFLEHKGCFHLPSRPILDELVREYFLHVHPALPVLDEGAFWRVYSGSNKRDAHQTQSPPIPLFVFRAMLFVSCNVSCPACATLRTPRRWHSLAALIKPVCVRQYYSQNGISEIY